MYQFTAQRMISQPVDFLLFLKGHVVYGRCRDKFAAHDDTITILVVTIPRILHFFRTSKRANDPGGLPNIGDKMFLLGKGYAQVDVTGGLSVSWSGDDVFVVFRQFEIEWEKRRNIEQGDETGTLFIVTGTMVVVVVATITVTKYVLVL